MGSLALTLVLLSAIQSVCSTQNTYHIKPAPDTPCPAEPCLTLSEYAQGHPLTSNTTLVFLPGNHSLDRDIAVTNVTRFVMLGDSTSGIICSQPASFTFVNISELLIDNLLFSYCGNGPAVITVESVEQFKLSRCGLQNSRRTSLFARESNLLIQDSTFQNSSGNGVAIIGGVASFEGVNSFIQNGVSGLDVSQSSNVTFNGSSTFAGNSYSGFHIGGSSNAMFIGSTTCMNNEFSGVEIWDSTASFVGYTALVDNSVNGLYVTSSSLSMNGTTVIRNNTRGFTADRISAVLHGNSTFSLNTAFLGGAVFASSSSLTFSGSSTFFNNSANEQGGAIYSADSVLNFDGVTSFIRNSAKYSGGAVYGQIGSIDFEGVTTFVSNMAEHYGGGAVHLDISTVTFNGDTKFEGNNVIQSLSGCLILDTSTVILNGNNTFMNNYATEIFPRVSSNVIESIGGAIYAIRGSVVMLNGVNIIMNNSADSAGGVAAALGGRFIFSGRTEFVRNTATFAGGGAFAFLEAVLSFTGETVCLENNALYGGGMILLDGTLRLSGDSHFVNNSAFYGGGIHASMSQLNFSGNSRFASNSATVGGGLSLSGASQCNLYSFSNVHFENNTARRYGGAIHVEDDPFNYCISDSILLAQFITRCFFEVGNYTSVGDVDVRMTFENNLAEEAGTTVYGGLIDRCVLSEFVGYEDSAEVFDRLTSIESTNYSSIISSDPIRVCPCTNDLPDCSQSRIIQDVFPGESFGINVSTVGQREGIVPSLVAANFVDPESKATFGDLEEAQRVGKSCTPLQYTVFSTKETGMEEMLLYAEGPCSTLGKPLSIQARLRPCPYGFEVAKGECTCEKRLQRYTNSCNINDRTIERNGDFWVGLDNSSGGVILHDGCPFDYCRSETVSFTLEDTDAQCNYERTGILCGSCQHGLSLALGTSQCLRCSNSYLALLIPFALAGIALVFLILALRLTVAVGTINALIFYANILEANHSTYFPPGETNILTVFIAWLNLDLGIETCFYDGMDQYAYTWLQFVFPVYIWALVGVMILASHFSPRISQFLGHNPISALATLFLLSYAKILRTIFAVLSFTVISYPDRNDVVWTYDGNIGYLEGKHIPLFLMAVVAFLAFFLPYTTILLAGQWIQKISNKKPFSWINHPRFKPLLDAYYAPYKDKHRYWTGHLLVIRFILLVIFAIDSLGDSSADLLATAVACTWIAFIAWNMGGVYRKWYLNLLESFIVLKLIVLTAATYYVTVGDGNQAALVNAMVSLDFMVFIGIVGFQIYQRVRNVKLWKEKILPKFSKFSQPKQRYNIDSEVTPSSPTTTTICLSELRESMLEESN